jgi:hypothetical protein
MICYQMILLYLRNNGEDHEVFGERHGGGEDHQGCPSQVGGPHSRYFSSSPNGEHPEAVMMLRHLL